MTIIIILLSLFTFLSIIVQFPFAKDFFNKIDKTQLLPNYSFFAPYPMMEDLRLVYKEDITESEWEEIEMLAPTLVSRLTINPDKYYVKGFIDSFNFLLMELKALEEDKKNFIQFSSFYINMLQLVEDDIKNKNKKIITPIRFAIVSTEHKNQDYLKINEVKFISLTHSVTV